MKTYRSRENPNQAPCTCNRWCCIVIWDGLQIACMMISKQKCKNRIELIIDPSTGCFQTSSESKKASNDQDWCSQNKSLPPKPEWEIIKITNRHNTKGTYDDGPGVKRFVYTFYWILSGLFCFLLGPSGLNIH